MQIRNVNLIEFVQIVVEISENFIVAVSDECIGMTNLIVFLVVHGLPLCGRGATLMGDEAV